jgi:hypothetical protein
LLFSRFLSSCTSLRGFGLFQKCTDSEQDLDALGQALIMLPTLKFISVGFQSQLPLWKVILPVLQKPDNALEEICLGECNMDEETHQTFLAVAEVSKKLTTLRIDCHIPASLADFVAQCIGQSDSWSFVRLKFAPGTVAKPLFGALRQNSSLCDISFLRSATSRSQDVDPTRPISSIFLRLYKTSTFA